VAEAVQDAEYSGFTVDVDRCGLVAADLLAWSWATYRGPFNRPESTRGA
jgi:hypothetical protein